MAEETKRLTKVELKKMVKDKARKQRLGELPEEAIDRLTKVTSADLDNVLGGSDMKISERVALAVGGAAALVLTGLGMAYAIKKISRNESSSGLSWVKPNVGNLSAPQNLPSPSAPPEYDPKNNDGATSSYESEFPGASAPPDSEYYC